MRGDFRPYSWFFRLALPLIVSLLPHILFSSLLFFRDPAPWPDEAYFLDVARVFGQEGVIRSTLCADVCPFRAHIRAFFGYPPFYPVALGIWTAGAGYSLASVRVLSVIASVASLVIFALFLVTKTKRVWAGSLGILLLTFFGPFGLSSRIGRMEIFIFLFLVSMLFFWERFLEKKRIFWATIAFLCAALAGMTHLVGALVPVILGFFLLTNERIPIKIKRSLLIHFLLIMGLTGFLWTLLILDRLDIFLEQLQIQFLYKSSREALLSLLFTNDIHWRLLILFYLSIASIGFVVGWIQKKRNLQEYSVAFFLSIFVIMYGKDQWYLVFLPVFPITLALIFLTRKKIFGILLFAILMLLHMQMSVPGIVGHLTKKEAYIPFSRTVSSHIPPGTRVLLATIPELYFSLQERDDITLFVLPQTGDITKLLEKTDVVVVNYATNNQLMPYIATHTAKTIQVIQEEGYRTDIVFLKK